MNALARTPEPFDPETQAALDRARLADFLARHWCDGPEDLATAVRQAILGGGGTWVAPDTGHRPASHLIEITLHGATATGMTPSEAIQNWRRVAERIALQGGTE